MTGIGAAARADVDDSCVRALVELHVDAMKGAERPALRPELLPARPLLVTGEDWRVDALHRLRQVVRAVIETHRTGDHLRYRDASADDAADALSRLWGVACYPTGRSASAERVGARNGGVSPDTLARWESAALQDPRAIEAVRAHIDQADRGPAARSWPVAPFPWWTADAQTWPPLVRRDDAEQARLIARTHALLRARSLDVRDEEEVLQVLRTLAFAPVKDHYFADVEATPHRRILNAPPPPQVGPVGRELQSIERAFFITDERRLDLDPWSAARTYATAAHRRSVARAVQAMMWERTADVEANRDLAEGVVRSRLGVLDVVRPGSGNRFLDLLRHQRNDPHPVPLVRAVAVAPPDRRRSGSAEYAVLMARAVAAAPDGRTKRSLARTYIDDRDGSEAPPIDQVDEVSLVLADRMVALELLRLYDGELLARLHRVMRRHRPRTAQAVAYGTLSWRDEAVVRTMERRVGEAADLLRRGKVLLERQRRDHGSPMARPFQESAQQLALAGVDLLRPSVEWLLGERHLPNGPTDARQRRVHALVTWADEAGAALDFLDSDRFPPLSTERNSDGYLSWSNWRVQTRLTRLLALVEARTALESRLCGRQTAGSTVELDTVLEAYRRLVTTVELTRKDLPLVALLGLWVAFLNRGVVPVVHDGLAPVLTQLPFLDDVHSTAREVDVAAARQYLHEHAVDLEVLILHRLPEDGPAWRYLASASDGAFPRWRGIRDRTGSDEVHR